jgi:hypothetical protein
MNDRLITALGAIVALVLIVGMFVQTPTEPPIARPTSAEEGANGYLGMSEWLQASEVNVQSLRLRYGSLKGLEGLSGAGHVLLTTPPYSKRARADELGELMAWVARGNTLIVAAALNDTPEWSEAADTTGFMSNLQTLTGTVFEAALNADGETIRVGEPDRGMDVYFLGEAFSRHPLAEGVVEVVAVTDGIASIWVPVEVAPGEPFLQESSTGLAAGWTRVEGNGHVITLAAGSLFSNRAIGREDNARLLSNLIQWHLAPAGTVLFDDLHHGLSEIYDPEAFYSDSRLGYTLLFVLAFWFAYMVGTSNRILPVRAARAVPKQGDLVRSMGGFLARKLPANGAAGLLFERWFETLAARAGSADRASIWAYLSASPLVSADALGQVRRMHNDFEAGGKVDINRLHNLILRITEAIG